METPEIQAYKDAVWDFMLEHSDILEGGGIFIKFHADGRGNFEKRIRARLKYDYHRIDIRTGESPKEKEARAEAQREARISEKKAKRDEYILSREKRLAAMAELKRENEGKAKWGKAWPMIRKLRKIYTLTGELFNLRKRIM